MARAFKFRMETLLRLRQRVFKERQRIVAARLRAIGRSRALVEAARLQIHEQVQQSRVIQCGARLDIASVRDHRAYIMFLNRRIGELQEAIWSHESQLERERRAMVEASVAVKALERIKEKRMAEHRAAGNRQEMAEHGEIALRASARRITETMTGGRTP